MGKIIFRLLSLDIDGYEGRPDVTWLEWFKSFLPVQILTHPIDFWSKVR
jgi:hypothetical protein